MRRVVVGVRTDGKRKSESTCWEEELGYRRDWEVGLVSNGRARDDLDLDLGRRVRGVVQVLLDVRTVRLDALIFHGPSHGHDDPEDPVPCHGHDHGRRVPGGAPAPLDGRIDPLDDLALDPSPDP